MTTIDVQLTPTTTTVRGACPHDCPDTCAMLVTVEEGRATKVAGDPEHPFTRGGLCVKVNNYPEKTYSPDRLLHPLRRTGPKGSGRFEEISWDEALDTIADTFRAKIAEHGPETVMPVSYLGTQGVLNGLTVGDAFFNRLGATVAERTYCDSGVLHRLHGDRRRDRGRGPGELRALPLHHHLGVATRSRRTCTSGRSSPRPSAGARRSSCIDPMRHRTAQRADWHIPIRPGTDGALALAMMHVIISEGLHDEAYVRDHTVGFDELAERVAQYTPEWASEETGIPVEDIRTLAREYATTDPVDDPHRRRDRAPRRRRADGALDRVPARARRGVAPRRRRPAAAPAVGAPGELAGVRAPRDGHPRHPRGQPVPARARRSPARWRWTRRSPR